MEKDPSTLIELAIQSLLSKECAAIHALGELPGELFAPLFKQAFKGGHKKILAAMVKVWPYFCLHIGKLSVEEPQCELLKAMVEGLQFFPDQNSASRSSKLRVLDLRRNSECKITCPGRINKTPMCMHSCTYSEHSILKIEAQCSVVNPEAEAQSSRQVIELLVDLSIDCSLKKKEFIALLVSKVQQSFGSLHLCCRNLQIDTLCNYKNTLEYLDLVCVDHLSVGQASLSEATVLLSEMVQLESLTLSKTSFRSLKGKVFQTFLMHLGRMDHLKEFNLSSFCLTNHLEYFVRVLPPDLDFLHLPFCELSQKDFRFLSQSPQANHLKLLDLSNNPMYWEDFQPLQMLLENLSGTLQHLEINHCLLTDSTISVLLPALSHCSQLRLFSFTSNPISMSMLIRIFHHLTPLMDLKYVKYPIPVHCYDGWYFQGHVDRQKLGEVRAQLKTMLEVAGRDDMKWVTFLSDTSTPTHFQP